MIVIEKMNDEFGFVVNTETKEAVLIFSKSPCDRQDGGCSIQCQDWYIVGMTKDQHGDHLIRRSRLSGGVIRALAASILKKHQVIEIRLNGDELYDNKFSWIYVYNIDQSHLPKWSES